MDENEKSDATDEGTGTARNGTGQAVEGAAGTAGCHGGRRGETAHRGVSGLCGEVLHTGAERPGQGGEGVAGRLVYEHLDGRPQAAEDVGMQGTEHRQISVRHQRKQGGEHRRQMIWKKN